VEQLGLEQFSDHFSVAFDSDRLTQHLTHGSVSSAEDIDQWRTSLASGAQ
jgi:hypothetical protein